MAYREGDLSGDINALKDRVNTLERNTPMSLWQMFDRNPNYMWWWIAIVAMSIVATGVWFMVDRWTYTPHRQRCKSIHAVYVESSDNVVICGKAGKLYSTRVVDDRVVVDEQRSEDDVRTERKQREVCRAACE